MGFFMYNWETEEWEWIKQGPSTFFKEAYEEMRLKKHYEQCKRELAEIQQTIKNDPQPENIDWEYVGHRMQCLQADITGYETAQNAIKNNDEIMPANPFEEGLG